MITIASPIEFRKVYDDYKENKIIDIKLLPLDNFSSVEDNEFILLRWNYFKLVENKLKVLFYYNYQTKRIKVSSKRYSPEEISSFQLYLYLMDNQKLDLSNYTFEKIDNPSFNLSDLYVNQFYKRFIDISDLVDDSLLYIWFKITDKSNSNVHEVSLRKGVGLTDDFYECDNYNSCAFYKDQGYDPEHNKTSVRCFLFREKGSLESSRTLIQESDVFYALLFHYYNERRSIEANNKESE